MGRYKPRAPLSAVQQLRLHYQPSPLTGPHALAKRGVNQPKDTRSALQLLRDCFLPRFHQHMPGQHPQLQHLASDIAAQSTPGTLVVPNPRHSRLPRHVLANDRPQPWQLLPMRAAAMQQYPDFFGQSCQFFASIHTAVLKGAATQLLRPSKVWRKQTLKERSCSHFLCSRSSAAALWQVSWRALLFFSAGCDQTWHASSAISFHNYAFAVEPGPCQDDAQPGHHLWL